ncbi:uncharacterized protein LOC106136660 isoform X2 [Amyelois transitella]|uniref:uncharacterized protein LOC106136660 isoform X2 n=1 Tax=Amyelois transitella TaxID=680683 RepID=UPI00298F5461|nr:uncharacterized protein LOC106136660 isoform X2 [Amyelois transitella]
MWLPRSAALASVALALCCLDAATGEGSQTTAGARQGGERKTARGARRVRTEPARPSRDIGIKGADEDYLVNVERSFRGNTFRELEEKRGRSDTLSRDFGDVTGLGFTPNERANAYASSRDSGADRDLGASRTPYNFRTYDYKDTNFNEHIDRNRDFGPARGRDESGRGLEPTRLRDYGNDAGGRGSLGYSGAADPKDTQTNLAQTTETESQRWLKILGDFLRSSKEGRELLRTRADHVIVGGDASGQLPLPLLLVPVAVPDEQCAVSKVSPQPEQPSDEYLPPHSGSTATPPVVPDSRNLRPEDASYTETLLELFRAIEPRAPLLPPLLLPESPPPVPPTPPPTPLSIPPPEKLRFNRSLLIRAELTVYYSDYTEPYTVWYDAESGSSRADLHGGSTALFRAVRGGDVQRLQLRIERHGEEERRRCTRLRTAAAAADRAPPGLPDPEPFRFQGYNDTSAGRLERWTYVVSGQAGELGGARGEALVFRHLLLVARRAEDYAVPYLYSVTVDSSVLGAAADRYEHRYLEVREQRPAPAHMWPAPARDCDALERADRVEHVDPLREFTMTHRDTRCDADFDKFKENFEVTYDNVVEEAIRKTMLIRNTRWVESANRQGASALMAVNELSVLLPDETKLLLGLVDGDGEAGGAGEVGAVPGDFTPAPPPEPFPYSAEDVSRLAEQLPPALSWKRQGAVTHIRNQGFCKTCWAFAAVAATEGALFLRTRALVPLSEQQLADCSAGPHSCGRGNQLARAYARLREGVAALANYSRYSPDEPQYGQCRKDDGPVTKISGYVRVDNSAEALKVALARHGPNVIEVDSECGGFMYFKAGVLIDRRCNPRARNHAITAVGFSTHKKHGMYFIAKNSWGLSGNKGYVHLHAASNAAGVHSAPSFPLLAADDVLRADLSALATKHPDEKSIFNTDRKSYRQFLKMQRKFNTKKKFKEILNLL